MDKYGDRLPDFKSSTRLNPTSSLTRLGSEPMQTDVPPLAVPRMQRPEPWRTLTVAASLNRGLAQIFIHGHPAYRNSG